MLQNYRGLRNGDCPASIYGLINNVGMSSPSYSKSMSDYIFVLARAGVDIGKHSLELGFQYDQRTSHYYGLNARS
jgi:hypothetical protein